VRAYLGAHRCAPAILRRHFDEEVDHAHKAMLLLVRLPLATRPRAPVGQTSQVHAERGIGKTWLLQTLALVAASGTSALGFHAASPCRVLHVDGEMFGEDLQERFQSLVQQLGVRSPTSLTLVAADWQDGYLRRLDTQAGQEALEPFIAPADLISLDNRSCLFDPEGEKDPTRWQPAQDWLLSLRRRGKAVVTAHHGNRQGGARGHSKPEDVLDVVIKLARPEDYSADQGARFVVSFEKTRGLYGAAVAPFTAHLTPDGWQTSNDGAGKALTERVQRRLEADARQPWDAVIAELADESQRTRTCEP
jgi:putative DNA primase/helicase